MAAYASVTRPWALIIPEALMHALEVHLFPGDGDEHGAVIAAGLAQTPRGARLLARDLFLARDGVDYVQGQYGYRMLTASFVRDRALYCRDEHLSYLAVHCHGGSDQVSFSPEDLASHERGYPALRDIVRGQVVGALVLARNAAAGDLWLPDGSRAGLAEARVVGRRVRWLYPAPMRHPSGAGPHYERQVRLFGDRGQAVLAGLKVGVIGTGGIGSLLVEYLSRLGVGHLVVADPDRIDVTNLPRVVGASRWDAKVWLTDPGRPRWLRRIGEQLSAPKVHIAARVARRANPAVRIEPIFGTVVDHAVAQGFVDCDYLFLAADSMQARLVFNALVHQYLIPGTQLGAKIRTNPGTGEIIDVFSVVRPVSPDRGCLWCNGLILPASLQKEALTEDERHAQRYVEDPDIHAPSVITLNAVAAAHGVNDFLFSITGLGHPNVPADYIRFDPRRSDVAFDSPRRDSACTECGSAVRSRFARGDSRGLPVQQRVLPGSQAL